MFMLLHEHACFTPARVPSIRTRVLLSRAYSTVVGQSRSRRGIPLQNAHPAPILVSRFRTHIPLPHALPAYARVSRVLARVSFLRGRIPLSHACSSVDLGPHLSA